MMSRLPFQMEACVVSLAQALEAQQKGAHRVELCIRLETEGMSPDFMLAASLCDHLHIPVRVMIRATESGYAADAVTCKKMVDSIEALKALPLDGFVLGVIRNHQIHREVMMTLLAHAHPLPVTFHKAIDLTDDVEAEIKWLNQFPQIDTILTSGGAIRAVDGISKMIEMKNLFHGHLMAAGKITPEVLPGLHDQLQLQWYHGRAIV